MQRKDIIHMKLGRTLYTVDYSTIKCICASTADLVYRVLHLLWLVCLLLHYQHCLSDLSHVPVKTEGSNMFINAMEKYIEREHLGFKIMSPI